MDGERVKNISPLFRISFPRIVEPERYQDTGAPRFSVSAIFNPKDPDREALVDLKARMLVLIGKVAAEAKLSLKADGVNPVRVYPEGKTNTAGDLVDGYFPGCAACTFSKHPKAGDAAVPCYGPDGQPISPNDVIPGYFGRVVYRVYKPKKFQKVALALVSLQVVAKGEPFGAGSADGSFDSVPGGDTVTGSGVGGVDDDFMEF